MQGGWMNGWMDDAEWMAEQTGKMEGEQTQQQQPVQTDGGLIKPRERATTPFSPLAA
jgi:hypothetical protein